MEGYSYHSNSDSSGELRENPLDFWPSCTMHPCGSETAVKLGGKTIHYYY